jgi:hypothetical protein
VATLTGTICKGTICVDDLSILTLPLSLTHFCHFVSYEQVLTHLYSHTNTIENGDSDGTDGAWEPVEGTSFFFFDGTSNEPMPRRDVYDSHYLPNGIQIAGIILASVAMISAFVTGLWVFVNRSNKLVKAGQPEFLYLLCFGAALVAPSSLFLTFDESDGLSTEQLSRMCSAFPWFFIIGYLLMYCALISKLWRLSKLMQLRRVVVHAKQVIFPIITIMGCSILVLIVWQIIDPVTWYRYEISGKGEPYETYGECSSKKYGMLPFALPIIVLMGIAVIATAVFSYKLRNVQSELAESSWIFSGIFIHIQTWLVGVPVLYITHGISKEAYYLMIVVLTFTFSTSFVGFVIGPKIVKIIQEKYYSGTNTKTKISITGGVSRISGLTRSGMGSNGSISLPLTTSVDTSGSPNNDSSKKLSESETEQLRLNNIALTIETESLQAHIQELELTVKENERQFKKAAKFEARVVELEKMMGMSNESGKNQDPMSEQPEHATLYCKVDI